MNISFGGTLSDLLSSVLALISNVLSQVFGGLADFIDGINIMIR